MQRFSNESAVARGESETQNTSMDENILLRNFCLRLLYISGFVFGWVGRTLEMTVSPGVGFVKTAIATLTGPVLTPKSTRH